jgi:DNA-binding NarL/FixJ family response regulator
MSPDGRAIRVVLADDQDLVRTGFRMILESEPGIEVVGQASDGEQAVQVAQRLQPDLVLMDIQMPGVDGLTATRRILGATPDVRVLILTTFERDDYIFDAVRAGASGFLLKNAPPEDLIRAVHIVAEGEALLAPSVTRRVMARLADQPASVGLGEQLRFLTEREVDVLRLMALGLSNAEIANELIVGESTVKTHVSRVLSKLHLRDRVQAVVFSYESGLVRPGG